MCTAKDKPPIIIICYVIKNEHTFGSLEYLSKKPFCLHLVYSQEKIHQPFTSLRVSGGAPSAPGTAPLSSGTAPPVSEAEISN
jgi:hypothetical protein